MSNLGATIEPSALPDTIHCAVAPPDERQCAVDPSDPRPCELDPPETVIEARPGWQFVDLSALWRYRELLYFLIWRDVKVRYKQTVLGATWAVIQPLATMVVFSLFFSRLSPSHSTGVPYPLFVFAGLLPWTFFSNAITSASQSIVSNHHLVTKVYFPRLIIPLASVGAGLLDFLIASTMLLPLMFYFGTWPSPSLLLTPLLVAGLVVAALGVGTFLAALTVAYRDFRYVVPFLTQLWMFATPCIYMQADAVLAPHWRFVLPLNPAYGLIANFRAAALGTSIDLSSLAISSAVSVLLLVVGCLYFRRVESSFADCI